MSASTGGRIRSLCVSRHYESEAMLSKLEGNVSPKGKRGPGKQMILDMFSRMTESDILRLARENERKYSG